MLVDKKILIYSDPPNISKSLEISIWGLTGIPCLWRMWLWAGWSLAGTLPRRSGRARWTWSRTCGCRGRRRWRAGCAGPAPGSRWCAWTEERKSQDQLILVMFSRKIIWHAYLAKQYPGDAYTHYFYNGTPSYFFISYHYVHAHRRTSTEKWIYYISEKFILSHCGCLTVPIMRL